VKNKDYQNFRTLSNKERAEKYAEIKSHQTYYAATPVSKWMHEWRIKSIINLIGDITDKVILDAGSGEGFFLSQIKAKEKYGIEISEIRVKRSIKHSPNLSVIIGDAKELPFEDNVFDVIVCSEVLEHVDNYQEALFEFKRCLKPSGILVISFPNERTVAMGRLLILKFPLHEIDHVNWITPKDIKEILGKKFITSNVPPIPYPFCLYQIYKFDASDLNSNLV